MRRSQRLAAGEGEPRRRRRCSAALAALTACARSGQGNLLDAARSTRCARAPRSARSPTRSRRCGAAIGRPRRACPASTARSSRRTACGRTIKADIEAFAIEEGRRPRIMVAKLGQDGHDRGAKVVATAFADLGFDVDIGPLFQTPEEAARQAIENDVHAIGVSTLAAGHKTLVPAIIEALRKEGASDIVVFVGGVVPPQDYAMLLRRPAWPASTAPAPPSRSARPMCSRRSVPRVRLPSRFERSGKPRDDDAGSGPARTRRDRAVRGRAARRPPRAGQGDHAGRVHARRPPGARTRRDGEGAARDRRAHCAWASPARRASASPR